MDESLNIPKASSDVNSVVDFNNESLPKSNVSQTTKVDKQHESISLSNQIEKVSVSTTQSYVERDNNNESFKTTKPIQNHNQLSEKTSLNQDVLNKTNSNNLSKSSDKNEKSTKVAERSYLKTSEKNVVEMNKSSNLSACKATSNNTMEFPCFPLKTGDKKHKFDEKVETELNINKTGPLTRIMSASKKNKVSGSSSSDKSYNNSSKRNMDESLNIPKASSDVNSVVDFNNESLPKSNVSQTTKVDKEHESISLSNQTEKVTVSTKQSYIERDDNSESFITTRSVQNYNQLTEKTILNQDALNETNSNNLSKSLIVTRSSPSSDKKDKSMKITESPYLKHSEKTVIEVNKSNNVSSCRTTLSNKTMELTCFPLATADKKPKFDEKVETELNINESLNIPKASPDINSVVSFNTESLPKSIVSQITKVNTQSYIEPDNNKAPIITENSYFKPSEKTVIEMNKSGNLSSCKRTLPNKTMEFTCFSLKTEDKKPKSDENVESELNFLEDIVGGFSKESSITEHCNDTNFENSAHTNSKNNNSVKRVSKLQNSTLNISMENVSAKLPLIVKSSQNKKLSESSNIKDEEILHTESSLNKNNLNCDEDFEKSEHIQSEAKLEQKNSANNTEINTSKNKKLELENIIKTQEPDKNVHTTSNTVIPVDDITQAEGNFEQKSVSDKTIINMCEHKNVEPNNIVETQEPDKNALIMSSTMMPVNDTSQVESPSMGLEQSLGLNISEIVAPKSKDNTFTGSNSKVFVNNSLNSSTKSKTLELKPSFNSSTLNKKCSGKKLLNAEVSVDTETSVKSDLPKSVTAVDSHENNSSKNQQNQTMEVGNPETNASKLMHQQKQTAVSSLQLLSDSSKCFAIDVDESVVGFKDDEIKEIQQKQQQHMPENDDTKEKPINVSDVIESLKQKISLANSVCPQPKVLCGELNEKLQDYQKSLQKLMSDSLTLEEIKIKRSQLQSLSENKIKYERYVELQKNYLTAIERDLERLRSSRPEKRVAKKPSFIKHDNNKYRLYCIEEKSTTKWVYSYMRFSLYFTANFKVDGHITYVESYALESKIDNNKCVPTSYRSMYKFVHNLIKTNVDMSTPKYAVTQREKLKMIAELDVNVSRATLLIRCLEQLMLLSKVSFSNDRDVHVSMLNGKLVLQFEFIKTNKESGLKITNYKPVSAVVSKNSTNIKTSILNEQLEIENFENSTNLFAICECVKKLKDKIIHS